MYNTEQESFWAGDAGAQYVERTRSDAMFRSKINFFSKILDRTRDVKSVIEYGANIGYNLRALKTLRPELNVAGVEINPTACKELSTIPGAVAFNESILEFRAETPFDMSLIKTVLIHINPEFLPKVYDSLYASSSRYICVAEYYNPSPTQITYRDKEDLLFKRDFAGDMLDRFSDLRLVDYGFAYKRDPNFPLDDITWFLLEKS